MPAVRTLAAALSLALALAATSSAQDCNGDGLPDPSQVNVQGLTAQYFPNTSWSGSPVAVRVELTSGAFDLSNWPLPPGVPEDQFTVRWTGGLIFNQTADFQFRVSSDDGFRLYLDGVLLGTSNGVTNDLVCPALPITVTQGIHHLRVELREDWGEQKFRLQRKATSATAWNTIPATNLRAGVDADANGILDLCDSGDCNGNLVPDAVDIALDPAADCNANGVYDSCESARLDCDRNGLPDSCEGSNGLPGLVGRYYATDDFSGPVVALRRDGAGPLGLDFNVSVDGNNDWQPAGVPTDHFSVRWSGALVVETPGNYDFQMQSDDFADMYVDGRLLFSSRVGNEERGPFFLPAGTHLVAFDLREFGGDQRFRIRWRPSGTSQWNPIPGDLLRTFFDGDGNGEPDLCESGDCDDDLVPDGLELSVGLDTDCDGNGLLDACDIAKGAVDCNANGTIDACEETVAGLYGRYFRRLGSADPADPYRPGELLARRREVAIDFAPGNWMPAGVPDSELVMIWTGSIRTGPESGLYRFRSESDDGFRLTVGDAVVIDRWLQNAGEGEGQVELEADTTYAFKAELHEGIGEQYARLGWKLPSASGKAPFVLVPADRFTMATPDCNGNGRPDDCDIADGSLPDPGAGIPDPCAGGCTGDLDGNGSVGPGDLTILLGNWSGSGAGDLDGDGIVSAADLTLLLGAWGVCG